MAKKAATAKAKKEKSMEGDLWESCNKLHGAVEPSEYKLRDVVCTSLINSLR